MNLEEQVVSWRVYYVFSRGLDTAIFNFAAKEVPTDNPLYSKVYFFCGKKIQAQKTAFWQNMIEI